MCVSSPVYLYLYLVLCCGCVGSGWWVQGGFSLNIGFLWVAIDTFPRDFSLALGETKSKDNDFSGNHPPSIPLSLSLSHCLSHSLTIGSEYRTTVSKKQSQYFKSLKKGVTSDSTSEQPSVIKNDYGTLIQLINDKIQVAESASLLV